MRAANLKPAAETAEGGLWGAADKAEAHVRRSAEVERDPALNAYTRGVICKLAAEYCEELRLYVVQRPFFNASVAPNGYIEVHTGLLLRARSEDELAFVMGHEVTHFARNHILAHWNATKTTSNVMLALRIGVTLGAASAMYSAASSGAPNAGQTIDSISDAAQALNDLIYLAGLASLYGYSREHETEADKLGWERYTAAGFDKAAAASIWIALMEETQASDFPKVRKSLSRASIFNTHPLTQDRIDALAALAGGRAEPSLDAQRRYRAAIRPHLGAWLRDDLRRRDYGQTLYLIERLSAPGEDLGVLNFYRGEAYRQRRGDGDAALALAAYRASVTHPDAPVAAWRELGEALRKSGDRAGAAQAFKSYLALANTADDRWLVEASVKSLSEGAVQ